MAWNPFAGNPAAPAAANTVVQPSAPANPAAANNTVVAPVATDTINQGANPNASDPNNPVIGVAPGSANNLPANQANPPTPQSPLEIFEQAWQPKPNDANAPKDFTLSVPQEVLDKVVPKLNLTESLPTELQQRIKDGDGTAMMEAINLVGQNTYTASLQHAMALVNHNLTERSNALPDIIDTQIQSNLTNQAVNSGAMPNANNPTVRRELQRVAQQFRTANPSASPQDIAKATKSYFTELQTAMTQAPINQQQQVQDSEWEDWLGT